MTRSRGAAFNALEGKKRKEGWAGEQTEIMLLFFYREKGRSGGGYPR